MIKSVLTFTSAVSFLSLASLQVSADQGLDLLIKKGDELPTKMVVQKSFSLNLDNPFLVQLYGSWRALNDNTSPLASIVDQILAKNDTDALSQLKTLSKTLSIQERNIAQASELYLLYQLGLNQTFFNRWVEIASNASFLNSGFGVALDEILKKHNGSWFIDNGIFISEEQRLKITQIKAQSSHFATLANSFKALRSGENALEFIGRLSPKDPLRLKLTDSAVLAFAKAGELGKSGTLLKEVYTPTLLENPSLESLSNYHIKLARLLYQAGAFEASSYYYDLIPKEASSFLTARTESLWISLRSNDSSRIKGDLKTLDLNLFNNKFIPEVYLVSSIANLRLCQFSEVKNAFDSFVRVNQVYAKEIENNLDSENPKVINQKDFYLKIANSSLTNIEKEQTMLKQLSSDLASRYVSSLSRSLELAKNHRLSETKRSWLNRKKILESTIRRMRFVKIEYLSQMRRLSKMISNGALSDSVRTVASGIKQDNSLKFPHNGVFFSDELFSVTSEVKDLCLRSRK